MYFTKYTITIDEIYFNISKKASLVCFWLWSVRVVEIWYSNSQFYQNLYWLCCEIEDTSILIRSNHFFIEKFSCLRKMSFCLKPCLLLQVRVGCEHVAKLGLILLLTINVDDESSPTLETRCPIQIQIRQMAHHGFSCFC